MCLTSFHSMRLWPDNASPLSRADLAHRKLYVLMSDGHIHVWRMHAQGPPTLVAVWDKLTPNHKDLALCITLMPTGSLDPKLADLQGEQSPETLLSCPVLCTTATNVDLICSVRKSCSKLLFCHSAATLVMTPDGPGCKDSVHNSGLSVSDHLHMHLCCSYSLPECSQSSHFSVTLVKVLPPCCFQV